MNTNPSRSLEHLPFTASAEFAGTDLATVRLIQPGAVDGAEPIAPRRRLRRLLGLQMDAFVAEALSGGNPGVLADRIHNIVQLSLELYDGARRGGDLPSILRNLDAVRKQLAGRAQAPAELRHALDPLLVAVLRGDLDPG